MTMTLTAFPDEYNLNITMRMMERFSSAGPLPHTLYAKQESTSKYQEIVDKYSGFGEAQDWADGAAITLDSAQKEFARTMTQEGFGLGFSVSRQFVRYDRLRQIQSWADALADSFTALLRTKHAYILINAFATVTYGDGKNLCATDHPTAGGGSRSNELAVATALSWDSFDSVRLLGVQHVDYRGKAMPIRFDQIIVPEQSTMKAIQIIGSAQEPFTTDNQINPLQSFGYRVVTEDRLTSSTAFFLQARNNHGILALTGYPVTFDAYVEQATKSLVHYGETDFHVDVTDWPGIAGTAGA